MKQISFVLLSFHLFYYLSSRNMEIILKYFIHNLPFDLFLNPFFKFHSHPPPPPLGGEGGAPPHFQFFNLCLFQCCCTVLCLMCTVKFTKTMSFCEVKYFKTCDEIGTELDRRTKVKMIEMGGCFK